MNTGTLSFPNNLGAQDLYNVTRPPTIVINGNTFATTNNHYVITNNTETVSLILPQNPTPGSVLWVTNVSLIFTHFCNRNGQRINGLEEDLILDVDYHMTSLRWIDETTGWLVS